MNKFKQFIKDYWYIFIILIAVIVYVITGFNNNKPANQCPSGQSLNNNCIPPKCATTCNTDEFYSCQLGTCVPICSPENKALVQCGKDYKCVDKDYKSKPFQISAFDDSENCQWFNGYNSDNCKLLSGTGDKSSFYEDCIDYSNKDTNPNYGKVLFGKNIPNNDVPSFKCGLPGSQQKGDYYTFSPELYVEGPNKYNILKKGDKYNDPFSNTCDQNGNKSSFVDIQSIDLTEECKNAAKSGIYKQDGTIDNVQGLDFCGYNNGYCKHTIDCNNSKNFTWRTYSTLNNCIEKLNDGKKSSIDPSRNCEIPDFMFPKNENGNCETTSLPTSYCTTGNGLCPDWIDSGFSGLEQSCTYDSNGYPSILRADDNVIEVNVVEIS